MAVIVIAEAGVNHNGSIDKAIELIDVARAARADVVKFQSFNAAKLATRSARKADYQARQTGADAGQSQYDMLKQLELSDEAHLRLAAYCKSKGIEFMSTPFDEDSLRFLVKDIGVRSIKLSSGDITNGPLLLATARTGCPLILSTGMSDLGEVEAALGILAFGYSQPEGAPSAAAFEQAYGSRQGRKALLEKVTLLHCTTEYPAPFADVNLRSMLTLQSAFGLPIGYSDHTQGIAVSVAAVAMGATVIEKHFTLDRNLPGPDHKASLEPGELTQLVQSIREVEAALGSPVKQPAASELGNRAVARKSLVAACAIRKGEPFTAVNLAIKRPGDGVSALRYWEWLGKIADRDYLPDEKVQS